MIAKVSVLLLVGLASLTDLHCGRVPNKLVAVFLLVATLHVSAWGLPKDYQLSFLVVMFMFFLWRINLLGAADVKVCLVLSLLLSGQLWLMALLICLFISLAYLLIYRKKQTMPMMPALFVGLLVVLIC